MATLNVSRFAGSWQAPHTPQINRGSPLATGLFFYAALAELGENAAHDAVSTLHQSAGIIHPGLSPAGYARFRSDITSNLEFGHFERNKVATGPFTLAVYGRLETGTSALNVLGNGPGSNQFRILTNYNGSGGASGYLNLFTFDGSVSDYSVSGVIDPNANHWYVCIRRPGGVLQIWRDAVLMGESTALTMRDVSGTKTDPMQIGFTTFNSAGRAISRASAWHRALMPAEIAALVVDPDHLTSQRRVWVPVTVTERFLFTAAAGAATTSSLAGASTAASAITAAAGAATASTVAGSATAASALASASGVATASTIAGAASTAAEVTPAAGAATASTVAAASTAAAAITQADGASTAGTLTGVAGSGSTITAAVGASTALTLAGASAAATAITAATGAATASTAAGASTAAATIAAAAGAATAATLTGSTAGDASAISPAAGAASAQIIVGGAFAQAAFSAVAGASTTSTLAGSSTSAAALTAASAAATASTIAGAAILTAAMTPATGAATASTLSSAASLASAMVPAASLATTEILVGASFARAAITAAAGAAIPRTLASNGLFVEPALRVYLVPAEDRTYVIAAENRTFTT